MINVIGPKKRLWMKEIRNDLELTMREIAEEFGISYQHYSDIENGRRNPSIELSLEMADFFDVPIEKFLEDRAKFKRNGE